jgi:ABC-type dipeptide/oligopeptide/nickel transport system permease subunit
VSAPDLQAEAAFAPLPDAVRPRSPGLTRSVLADRRAWIAVPILLVLVVMAIHPTWFELSPPTACDLDYSLLRPSFSHPFGTDLLGCDLWSRTVFGTRNSMIVGVGSVVMAGVAATVLGAVTALSRILDSLVRTLVDLLLGIPVVLVALTVLTAIDRRSPLLVAFVLAVFVLPLLARVMRSEVLRVSRREYVDAARAMGAGPGRLLFRHIAPNAVGPMIAVAVLSVATMVTTEAIITFLGVGLKLPNTSWGILLQQAGQLFRRAPHLILPGSFLVVATGALVLLAEVVRDVRPPS